MKRETNTTAILLGIYLLILTWIILFKMQVSLSALPEFREINLIPFAGSVVVNGRIYWDEIWNNALVFVPVGLYIGMLKPENRFIQKLLPVAGLSLVYEVLQYLLSIGASDVTDIITNTAGGAAGLAVYFLLSRLLKEKTNRILNRAAIVCTALVCILLALLIGLN